MFGYYRQLGNVTSVLATRDLLLSLSVDPKPVNNINTLQVGLNGVHLS